ncbi:carbohydrate ABC transporter permease [Allofournierella sp.]|uniref:carbohydrate ABC transporter permease n=1 Tax=Allofournierella sp. TaxID=1940256 RepID=UPI003AB37216
MKSKRLAQGTALHAAMGIVVVICVFPVLWSCVISVKSVGEKVSGFSALAIQNPTLANYARLFQLIPIGQQLGNSVFTAVVGTVTTLFFCALAGFAFAKYQFPYRDALFYFVVATMTIPAEVGAVPLFLIMKEVGLINSLWSLILPRLATAVGVFYLRQYILEVPDDILDAARIDGCRDFGLFWKIVCPVIKPALASWASLTLIARWNDFFWPLLFLNKPEKHTLMVSVSTLPLTDGLATPWQVILAGTTLVIVPSVLLYLAMQTFQKAGALEGAIKG